jgi:putative restriction endonuclease
MENRVNPMNGLCLNALHDRAFDNGLISIDENYNVIVSKKVKHKLILQYEHQQIKLPDRFLPDQKFLSFHRKNIFLKH